MLPVLLFSGCIFDKQPIGEVVAKVNDEVLSTVDVEAWEAALGEVSVPVETRRSFIRNWVEEELLFQEALSQNLMEDPWVVERLHRIKRTLLISRFMESEAFTQPQPSAQSIKTYYQEHSAEFVWPVIHLDVEYWRSNTSEGMGQLRKDLMKSKKDIIWTGPAGDMVHDLVSIDGLGTTDPKIWKVVSALKVDGYSGVLKIDETYWIFKLINRKEAGEQKGIEEVQPEISAILHEADRVSQRDELIQNLIKEYREDGRLMWAEAASTISVIDTLEE
ncbi:MAG: hypothetical protein HN356_15420 [Calditrichaeota bacterium]|nr:hypothetical protein [Calditrichota bacterium]MBT7617951.1 hypothetical protein [Calditrichota bacterium]MBT7787250.1 hypothetical protein [Calditrichota bacterium]